MNKDLPKVIVIFGPTSSGKTELSLKVAKYIFGAHNVESEFISADSRQHYKGLNVGTNKIDKDLQAKFQHHLIDNVELNDEFTTEDFKAEARKLIQEITDRGHIPIVVGGTASYILELFSPNHFEGRQNKSERARYRSLLLLPDYAREPLYRKIERNVDKMFKKGLYKEVLKIVKAHDKLPLQMRKTLGYKEFVNYVRKGKRDIKTLNSADLGKIRWKIKANTKKYAMHQDNLAKKLSHYVKVYDFDGIKNFLDDFMND